MRLPGSFIAALVLFLGLGCHLPESVEWERRYGGPDAVVPVVVCRGPDSGYVVLAEISDRWTGATAAWLLRLDDACDTLWTRSFGIGRTTRPHDLLVTGEGNLWVSGITDSPDHNRPFTIEVRGSDGSELFRRTWPEPHGYSSPRSEPADADTIAVASLDSRNVVLQHVNSAFYPFWTKTYSLVEPSLSDLVRLEGGGYCLVGRHRALGVSAAGDSGWSLDCTTLGPGPAHGVDIVAAAATDDGGAILTGAVYTDSGARLVAVQVSAGGELLWHSTLAEPPASGYGVLVAEDGGSYVVGGFSSASRGTGGIVVKVGPDGGIEWERRFSGSDYGRLSSAAVMPDGNLLLLGLCGDRLLLIKMQP